MKTYELIIEVDKELFTALEVAYFELSARQDIVDRILTTGKQYNEDTFNRYHKEMVEYKKTVTAYQNELQSKYVIPYLKENESVNCEFDFNRETIILQSVTALTNLPANMYKEVTKDE